MSEPARRAAELAARDSYGRLVAWLAWRWGDLAAAEDALSEAFAAALETWPTRGIPDSPSAWLASAARNAMREAHRRSRVRNDPALAILFEGEEASEPANFPDDRLKLLFICAHPAIDPAARTPLMLQSVLGFDAARIASAFLVSPAAMGQRLVRAKARIREARLRFEEPEPREWPERLEAVLDAIYAAYGAAWEDMEGADSPHQGLAEEAIWLARLVVNCLPEEPEAHGLLALLLHCEARRAARRSTTGSFVPLSEQDPGVWSGEKIDEAESRLAKAANFRRFGRFQLEAAIQSAHAQRAVSGQTPWEAIALLYEGLVRFTPTAGVLLNRAAAIAQAQGASAGWTALESLASPQMEAYQPYWALRAHLEAQLGHRDAANSSYRRAMGLTEDAAVRKFLLERIR